MAITAITMAVSSAATAVVSEAVAGMVITGMLTEGMAMVVGAVAVGVTQYAVGSVVSSALGGGGGSSYTPAPSAVAAQQARGILINAASSIDPLRVIYGSRRVGGTYVIPPSVSGANNEYLHLVIAIGEGEIAAINMVYLDDTPATDARFAGLVTIEKFLGTDTQAASAMLIAALPGIWTAAHQGKAVAYLHVRLKADQTAFNGLPLVTCDVDGKMVFDPRDGLTKFSHNPSLCIRDYLTSARYGRGILTANLDDAAFIVAANHCDDLVSIPGGLTQVRYTCDGIINVDETVYANYQRLLGCCRAMPGYSGGKYKIIIDKVETPSTFSFNEDNITGAWEFFRPGKRDMLNKVTASFFNPANNWQPDFSIQDSATYRAADNGLMLERKIDLPFTADAYRAGHLAQLSMKSSRFGMIVRFSAFQEGLRCEVGDVVPITHSTPGWVNKPFRVMTIDILNEDNVTVMLQEYDASAYTLDALSAVATSPQTTLPNMFNVAAPTGLSVAVENIIQPDGTFNPRLIATWTDSPDAHLIGYDVAWSENSGPWDTTTSRTPRWMIPASMTGRTYDVRVRAVNAIGKYSSWLTTTSTVAAGPTTVPAAVSFTATGISQAVNFAWVFGDARQDISATEVWWAATNDRATAVMLSSVPFPAKEYRHQPLAAGTGGYYWMRVSDTFQNKSAWYPSSATAGVACVSLGIDGSQVVSGSIATTGIAAGAVSHFMSVEITPGTYAAGAIMASITFPAEGGELHISSTVNFEKFLSSSGMFSGSFSVWRPGFVPLVKGYTTLSNISTTGVNLQGSMILSKVDAPVAGSYTYDLHADNVGGVLSGNFMVLELKR